MVAQSIISQQRAAQALEAMLAAGSCLPRRECEQLLRRWKRQCGMVPMAVDAFEKAREGITSLSEVMRVVLLGL